MPNGDGSDVGGGWEGDVAEETGEAGGTRGTGTAVMIVDHDDVVDVQEMPATAPGGNAVGGVSSDIREAYPNLANAIAS